MGRRRRRLLFLDFPRHLSASMKQKHQYTSKGFRRNEINNEEETHVCDVCGLTLTNEMSQSDECDREIITERLFKGNGFLVLRILDKMRAIVIPDKGKMIQTTSV